MRQPLPGPCDVTVLVHLSGNRAPAPAVTGRIESRYGAHDFCGWLDLLGQLEGLVELARSDTATPR